MRPRPIILLGMAGGALWAVVLLWFGRRITGFDLPWALVTAGFCAGAPLAAMIGRLAAARFFQDSLMDGDRFASGSAEDIDQRVLSNTVEQIALAVCLWPLVGVMLGAGTVVALGAGFAIMRGLFWLGYHMAPPLRALGFAGTFYPTILAVVYAVAAALTW